MEQRINNAAGPLTAGIPAELPMLKSRIDRHFANYGGGHITCVRRPGVGDVRLTTNDYLSLGRDRRILEAQLGALTTADSEVYMSGVYIQYLDAQRQLESQFAKFLGCEDAVICQSGFAANEGLIQSLADPTTPVYLDTYAHASLWQGALAAQAPAYRFRHNDPDHLRQQAQRHGPGVVVVDAIYSTSGDTCSLEEVIGVCEELGCTADALYAWRSRLRRTARNIAHELTGATAGDDEGSGQPRAPLP